MAIYKCKKTGAIVTADSELKGSWELVKEEKPAAKSKTKKEE